MGVNLQPMARDFYISEETFEPTSHDVADGVITPGAHTLLRFDFASYNAGDMNLDVGRPEDNPDLFVYSQGHGHYHLSDFNNYTLFDSQGQKVGDSYKQAFCLMDTTPVISSADPTYTCDYQGISAGWADWYESTLPGQYIVIDGLRNGNYRLQVTTDYKNYFQEGNENDNTISIGLNIKDNEATWIGPFWEPDVRIGGNGDDTLIADLDRVADFWGGGGNDMLTGSGLADKLRGEKGNDTVSGLAGDDELDGGEGHDTAVFHSDFSEYTFAFTDAGIIVTDKISDGDGSDTLRSIEAARFADRTVSLVNTIHEKPVLSKTSFKEDILVDTILAKVSAQDEEGDQLTYTLTDNAGGYFRLSGQHLLLSKELDHETLPQHTITIAAMDKFGRTISETYTIDVADVTEPVGPGTPPDNGGGTTPGGGTPVDGTLTLIGTRRADRLKGEDFNDLIKGLSGNDRLWGQGGNDKIYGGSGKDKLYGGAGNDLLYSGSGNDVLYGQTGRDAFVFDAKLGTARTDRKMNFDKVADFNVKADSFWLDNAVFKKLGGKGSEDHPAKLKKAFFTIGDHAQDKNDYLIYDRKTGVLSYDADGSGAKAAVEFAGLKKGLKLSYHDFLVT